LFIIIADRPDFCLDYQEVMPAFIGHIEAVIVSDKYYEN
jgi:hypothetical protein